MKCPLRLAALAAAVAMPLLAHAQSRTETVIVTATRLPEVATDVPVGVSVIPKREIQSSPATNLPDLLRQRAGIEVRSLFGPLAIDATVDLRGLGEAAGSNVLVLLDGQRLNAVDSGSVIWSTIPLAAIERIEILRGAGTVLYGDRAVGGVINIITDKSGRPSAALTAGAGRYGYRALDAELSGGGDLGRYTLVASAAQSDGYRDNGQADQQALSGRVATMLGGGGEVFADFGVFKDSSGLPGALFSAQFESNPRFSRRPLDTQQRDGHRLRPGITWQFGPDLVAEAEIASDSADLNIDTPGFIQDRERDNLSLTPRLRWQHGLGGLASSTVLGVDAYRSEVEARSISSFSGANTQTAEQRSVALYFQNTTRLSESLALTAGARRQRLTQAAADQQSAVSGSARRTLNAWDLGASWNPQPDWRVYGRHGRLFRFPNTDELFGFDPFTFATVFRGDLRPQRGNSSEVGAVWRGARAGLSAQIYRLDLTDELGLDNATFTNVNLPRTRREGIEVEGDLLIGSGLRVRAGWAAASAKFREGPDDGRTIPLVARQKGSVGLELDAGNRGRHRLDLSLVGKRYAAGDTANARTQVPGYASADWRSDLDFGPWRLTLRVLNAFDKRYASFAGFQSFPANDFFYYPADGRTVIASARYAWR
jgi:iron complex outermembrane receptor protein